MLLGLIVNEIVTNAFKHAFAGRKAGLLRVGLSAEGKTAKLVIEDDGPGYVPSERQGMGRRLIDAFVAQLGGTLTMDTLSGTKIVVTFPVD